MALRTIVYHNNSFEIAYTKIDNKSKKNILFLHGWGSNKELMKLGFGECFKDFNHYYIDLPGFGESPNEIFITTNDYAHIIMTFCASIGIYLDIIVGHSFGGKVAMLCAKNNTYMKNTSEILLLSSAGIVTKKSLKTKAKIALAKVAKACGIHLAFLRSKDAHNLNPTMYEVFKSVVNEDFCEIFRSCKRKVTIFWGREDTATPLSSGELIHSLIPHNRFFVCEGDHYFFLKQGKVIEKMYNQENTNKKLLHILVFGKVQGVGYRKFAKAIALEYMICGTTQNLKDGSVEIFACGEESALEKFLKFLYQGPQRSEVSKIDVSHIDMLQEFDGFMILEESK